VRQEGSGAGLDRRHRRDLQLSSTGSARERRARSPPAQIAALIPTVDAITPPSSVPTGITPPDDHAHDRRRPAEQPVRRDRLDEAPDRHVEDDAAEAL
jgi:hypothetical protein